MIKKETIKTERLTLVPMEMKYLYSTHEYASDKENTPLMVFLPTESLEETKEYILKAESEWEKERPDYIEFALFCDSLHVGSVTLYILNGGRTAELGWILKKEHRQKGFATEAAAALMEYAAERLHIRHIIAQCDSENEASKKVMEKLGLLLTDTTGTRKNKLSDEVRREYTYEKHIILS